MGWEEFNHKNDRSWCKITVAEITSQAVCSESRIGGGEDRFQKDEKV